MSKSIVLCYDDAVEDTTTGPEEIIMIDRETGMGADTATAVAHIKTTGGMTGGTDGNKRVDDSFAH